MQLSYDLHVHPGSAVEQRWGDGRRIWEAARAAGVRGFVWKDHRRHSVAACRQLPAGPVEAFPSASLNPWASLESVIRALDQGARWLWAPTQTDRGTTGWELPLPVYWPDLAEYLAHTPERRILATAHTDRRGRAAFAELAERHPHLLCAVTHAPFISLQELDELAAAGCAFEIDAYTQVEDLGRPRTPIQLLLERLQTTETLVYFTSDGGQTSTGNPFTFAARVLEQLRPVIGMEQITELAQSGPLKIIDFLQQAPGR